MTIKPIRTEQDHESALRRIDELFSAAPGTPEFDELDVLATLVDVYERAQWPIDPPTPVEMLKFRIEQGQFTRADLARILGSSSKVTEVLAKKRSLSKGMVVALHDKYEISFESLLGDVRRPPVKHTPKAKHPPHRVRVDG